MPTERQRTVDQACREIAGLYIDRRIDEIIVHHTWKPRAEDYRGIETVRGVRRYHMQQRGWSDNGYHIMVGPQGQIFFCRPFARSGGHTLGHNAHSIGISYIADFDAQDPNTYAGLQAGQRVVAVLLQRFNLDTGALHFHREFANKSCPGSKMDRTDYRQAVNKLMNGDLKIVLLPGSEVIDCSPGIYSTYDGDDITLCRLRPLAEALGYEVIADHLAEQNKIYLRKKNGGDTDD